MNCPSSFVPILLLSLCFLHLSLRAQESEGPLLRPINRALEPGQLIGWASNDSRQAQLDKTLPTGHEAEGFVQVTATGGSWMALHEHGWVRIGGFAGSWQNFEKELRYDSPVEQIAAQGNRWILRLADGSIRCGSVDGRHPPELIAPPEDLQEVDWVGVCDKLHAARQRDGRLVVWGHPDRERAAFQALFDPIASDVSVVGIGNNCILWTRTNGDVYIYDTFGSKPSGAQEALRGAQVLTGGYGFRLGILPDRRLAAKILNDTDRAAFQATFPGPNPKVIRAGAIGGSGWVQQEDGTWVSWTRPTERSTSDLAPERLGDVLAFEPAGNGFVIGIRRSRLNPPSPDQTDLPALRTILTDFKATRTSAEKNRKDFEARYLQELDKLAQRDPSLAAAISEERHSFRNEQGSLSSQPALARLQRAFRDRASELRATERKLVVRLYEQTLKDLQRLQDELTREQRLGDAVEARTLRADLAYSFQLYQYPPSASSEASSEGPAIITLEPIPPSERIFSIHDPLQPGELVVLGSRPRDEPWNLPDAVFRERFTNVDALGGRWLALQEDGSFFCSDAPTGSPGGLRKLNAVKTLQGTQGYVGYDHRDRLVQWRGNASLQAVPQSWKESRMRDFDLYHNDSVRMLVQALAIQPDGTLTAAGELYERSEKPFQIPSGLQDCVQVIAGQTFSAVRLKNGNVRFWDAGGLESPRQDWTGIVKLTHNYKQVLGLREDGTVVCFDRGGSTKIRQIPRGLTEVVDIDIDGAAALALRADGTWVLWGQRLDEIAPEIPKLKGCRRAVLGGSESDRYIIGLRPAKD